MSRPTCCERARTSEAIGPVSEIESWQFEDRRDGERDPLPRWAMLATLKPDSPSGYDRYYAAIDFCPFCGTRLA